MAFSDQCCDSAPAGTIALGMIFLAMPASFPHQSTSSDSIRSKLNKVTIWRFDFLGAFLLLGASILFVSAVEEGGTEYSWKSPVIIALLPLSTVLWIVFFFWEKYVSGRREAQEPVLPWRLIKDRFAMGFLL